MVIPEEAALAFRARRGHLLGPGAPDPVSAARAILGAQAQQLAPALRALSMRMAQRPTAEDLSNNLLATPRTLVRTWGQRDTLHVFDPADWPRVVAARAGWAPGGRRVAMPPEEDLVLAREVLESSPEPITRRDLFGVLTPTFLAEAEPHIVKHAKWMLPKDYGPEDLRHSVQRFAAGRLLWCLANDGHACSAGKRGSEQLYAARVSWFPELAWAPTTPKEANLGLTRRYLSLCAPATAADVAHFLGARVSDTKKWLAILGDEVVPVTCGERKGLFALAQDTTDLNQSPPEDWPVRLMPLWDTLLMTHTDKTWIAPTTTEHKAIWKRAAMVCATVLDRGRIVATWSQKLRARRIDVTIQPLGAWRKGRHLRGVQREADALADHLGLPEARVQGC